MNIVLHIDERIETAVQTHTHVLGEVLGTSQKFSKAIMLVLSLLPGVITGQEQEMLLKMPPFILIPVIIKLLIELVSRLKGGGALIEGIDKSASESSKFIKGARLIHLINGICFGLGNMIGKSPKEGWSDFYNLNGASFWLYVLFQEYDDSDKGKTILDHIKGKIAKKTKSLQLQET